MEKTGRFLDLSVHPIWLSHLLIIELSVAFIGVARKLPANAHYDKCTSSILHGLVL
ncbi:hypothetical protein GALMADRAFT_238228 [Galerina marginata CBS 339.88]|uniref:Uncharacterized protein n=1 Tax=Galerina marginata (strain CBS 339.88) TaxID=685588 RepID=A0A067TS28_GALM3|nr:hypothetical protein GALMADRAFT_238228 [Galerina marginata CBS 339.88]